MLARPINDFFRRENESRARLTRRLVDVTRARSAGRVNVIAAPRRPPPACRSQPILNPDLTGLCSRGAGFFATATPISASVKSLTSLQSGRSECALRCQKNWFHLNSFGNLISAAILQAADASALPQSGLRDGRTRRNLESANHQRHHDWFLSIDGRRDHLHRRVWFSSCRAGYFSAGETVRARAG